MMRVPWSVRSSRCDVAEMRRRPRSGFTQAMCGALALCLAAALCVHRVAFSMKAVRVSGAVVGSTMHISTDPRTHTMSTSYCPTLSFQLPGAKTETRVSSAYCGADYPPGKIVSVLVDPADLNTAEVASFVSPTWLAVLFLAALGGLFLSVGLHQLRSRPAP